MEKSVAEQMNDLVAGIVKGAGARAALNYFATALALTDLNGESPITNRVGDIADEFDDGSREEDDDEAEGE